MRVRVEIPGSFVVSYSYTEKHGTRRRTMDSTIAVSADDIASARVAGAARRGHLDNFKIKSVVPDYAFREATREEEVASAQESFARLRRI